MLMFMSVFDLGRYVFADNEINNAAREGVRTAIVNQYLPDINGRASAQAIALGIPTATPSACDATTNVPADPSGVCVKFVDQGTLTKACSPITVGCVAVVTVKYTYQALTPIIGNVVIGPRAVVSTSKQPVESVCTTSGCPIP